MGRLRTPLPLLLLLAACGEPERPFVMVLGSEPSSFDPHWTNESAAFAVNSNLYDSLVETDPALAILPRLATRWLNPDELTWVFEVRRDVRFHDGTLLQADDVVASLVRARDHPRSQFRAALQSVVEVEASSAYEVRVRTHEPTPTLLRYLVPIAIAPSERLTSATPLERDPVGSGPYRFIAKDAGTAAITLRRFAGFWGGNATLDRVTVRAIPDEKERLRMLVAGAADLITDVPPSGVAQLRSVSDLRLLRATGLRETFLVFDVSRQKTPYASPPRNPFLDKRVRQAFVHAVDRGRLVREVLLGFGQEATQFAAPGVFGFNPEIRPTPFDPEAARRLLAEAGHPAGFSLTLDAPRGVHPGDADAAQRVAEDLRAVGVAVQLNLLPKEPMFDKLARRDISLCLATWNSLSGDMQEIYLNLLKTPRPGSGQGDDNAGGYSNPAVDAVFEEAGATSTPDVRLQRLKDGVALAIADVPWVPLFVQDQLYGIRAPYDWPARPDKRVRLSEVRRR